VRERERRKERVASAVKKRTYRVTPDPPTVYIGRIKYLEYPAYGPENPDQPETPGIRPETPAPPQSEQTKA